MLRQSTAVSRAERLQNQVCRAKASDRPASKEETILDLAPATHQ